MIFIQKWFREIMWFRFLGFSKEKFSLQLFTWMYEKFANAIPKLIHFCFRSLYNTFSFILEFYMCNCQFLCHFRFSNQPFWPFLFTFLFGIGQYQCNNWKINETRHKIKTGILETHFFGSLLWRHLTLDHSRLHFLCWEFSSE